MARLRGEHEEEVDASPEACFAVAADLDGTPAWHGTMQEVEVIERDADGRATQARIAADAGIAKIRLELAFSYDAPHAMRWKRTGGDLSDLEGAWAFEALGDGRTRVRHTLELDPGRKLGLLARGPVVDRVRDRLVVQPAQGLKRAVEASAPPG